MCEESGGGVCEEGGCGGLWEGGLGVDYALRVDRVVSYASTLSRR